MLWIAALCNVLNKNVLKGSLSTSYLVKYIKAKLYLNRKNSMETNVLIHPVGFLYEMCITKSESKGLEKK